MSTLEELDNIEKLRMFYKADVYEKIAGTSASGTNPEDKQKYLFSKIFNDKKIANSIDLINIELSNSEETEPQGSLAGAIASLFGEEETETESTPLLFEASMFKKEISSKSSVFGDIGWTDQAGEQKTSYLDGLLKTSDGSIPDFGNKGILLVKVKSDEIHPAFHSSEESEVFLNYIPAIERSRCAPLFSVDIFTRGNFYGASQGGSNWNGNSGIADAIDMTISDTDGSRFSDFVRAIPSVTTIKFLNDYETVDIEANTADSLMARASTELFGGTSTTETAADGTPARYQPAEGSEDPGGVKPALTKNAYTVQRNGMEMFTMPQSLMSKKQGSNIDPFRPFMSIKSAKITTHSVGQGILAWNTAELVLEVYDRHRLNDISFLLDPSMFSFTKFELTAGWKHQDSFSPYGKYIERMQSKEMYALQSSTYSFNDSGVVTVNLKLAMSGGEEISNSSMFSNSGAGKGIREAHASLLDDLRLIRAGTASINAQRTSGNLLPTSVITQENEASAMVLDTVALSRVRAASSQGEMSDAERDNLNIAIANLQGGKLTEYYTMLDEYVEALLTDSGLNSGEIEPILITRPGDVYEYLYTADNKWMTRKTVDGEDKEDWLDLPAAGILILENENRASIDEQRSQVQSGGSIKLDKLIMNALVKRLLTGEDSSIDEVHVFMYKFNDNCPSIRGQYIGDFNVNVDTVSEKMKKTIRETQNITISSFLGVINSELKDKENPQFNIIQEDQSNQIRGIDNQITAQNNSAAEISASIVRENEKLESATSETQINEINSSIEALTTRLNTISDRISDLSDQRTELFDNAEQTIKISQGTSKIEMPDLKILTDSKRSSDGKNILRFHIYDAKTKPNELQTFLSNLNNSFSMEIDENEIGASLSASGPSPSTQREKRTNIREELLASGIARIVKIVDSRGNESQRLVVNTQSHKLKKVVKDSMASITYGVEGTAINKASMSMIPDRHMQTIFLLRTQNENSSDVYNQRTQNNEEDAQKIMPANITLDLMGCPILRYGQEYFVDFDTNTDLDNVYLMTKIVHSIGPGEFKTTAELTPNYRTSLSFTELLNDIQFLTDEETETTLPATSPSTSPE